MNFLEHGSLMQTITHTTKKYKRDGEHLLVSLTYIAKNSEKYNGVELTRILEKWRRNNEKSDITSALIINDDYLIQNIEGTRPVINDVLVELISEYSHLLPHIVEVKEIEARKWDGFLIKYLTASAEDENYALKSFSARSNFNPYLMKRTQITSFIKAIFEDKEI